MAWRRESPLTAGLSDPCAFYHVHSFAAAPRARRGRARHRHLRRRVRVAWCERDNVFGVQFHPEKSGPDGLALLRNFAGPGRRGARMILLPAVDIRDGKAVRLRQGRFEDETVYADDPLEAARSFVEAGARYLHVVDLDGARDGEPANLHHLERITSELGVPVRVRRRPALAAVGAQGAGRRRRAGGGRHRRLHRRRVPGGGAGHLGRARARGGRRARRPGVGVPAGRARPRCCPSS